MTRPIRFSHAVLKSYDVRRLRDWYCEALGARVVFEKLPKFSYLAYDEEHHRLGISGLSGPPVPNDPRAPGLVHLAFAYANIRDLLGQYKALRHRSIRPIAAVNHGPTVSFYYCDPDGNGVEFLVDRFVTGAEAQAFIDHVFDRNPAGIDIDPEEMLARMEAGASDDELVHYDQDVQVDADDVIARHRELMGAQ